MYGSRALTWLGIGILTAGTASAGEFSFKQSPGKISIRFGNQPVATYIYSDKSIKRPHFAHLYEPGGFQVTRNHPPKKGDSDDHATMHPGLWMAFGDIAGEDFWRNKGTVEHVRFIRQPESKDRQAWFAVENQLVTRSGEVLCQQQSHFHWQATGSGYLLSWDVKFLTSKKRGIYFGDQEEMGVGVRVATRITEDRGNGKITSSSGKTGAKNTWGQPAKWCDYSATIGDRHIGVALLADPKNSRVSWWHNRGYGLMVANAFGRKAMRQGPTSKLEVPANSSYGFRYGVFVYGAKKDDSLRLEETWASFAK